MKIAFLLTQSLDSPSGLGRYGPIAKELQHLGHSVTILALHHNILDVAQRRSTWQGVDIWYVGQMHVRKVGDDKLYFRPLQLLSVVARGTLGLLWAALHVRADVYHIAKPHPMNGLAGLAASHLRRKPLYLDCDDYEAGSNRFGAGWQRRVVAFFEDHLPHHVKGVTVNTRFTQHRLEQLGCSADRIVYVPNGVERERFKDPEPAEAEALRSDLGLHQAQVVLYVGSMSLSSHAVDLLIEAFADVRAACDDAVLLLVGGGEDLAALRNQASSSGAGDAIHFVGKVPPDRVRAYYQIADVVVDPVRDDQTAAARSPLKIVESLACGVPVVTGDIGDRAAMLRDGALGLLASPGSADDLARKIVCLLQDPALRKQMVGKALNEREAWYWDRLVEAFLPIYEHS